MQKIRERYQHISSSISSKVLNALSSTRFMIATVVLFIVQATYISISTPLYLPPDETHHFGYIRMYAANGLSPFLKNSSETWRFGDVEHNPFFLYHYVMSFPYRFVSGFSDGYIILRFINTLFGVGTLLVMYLIAREMKMGTVQRNVAVFLFANTMMFVFISSAVNYDNLVILLSLLSALCVLKLWQKFSPSVFLVLCISVLAGSMTKVSFLPLIPIFGVILLVRYWRTPVVFVKWVGAIFSSKTLLALTILLITLCIPFVALYVVNVVKYKNYSPACAEVMTTKQCDVNAVYRRDRIMKDHPAPITLTTRQYLVSWYENMKERTFGILAHKNMDAPRVMIVIVDVLILISAIAAVRYFRPQDTLMIISITIVIMYLLALLRQNRSTFLATGSPDLAVQGRYSFMVLPLVYLLASHYGYMIFKNKTQKAIASVALVALFYTSTMPVFILNMTDEWKNFGVSGHISRIHTVQPTYLQSNKYVTS